MLSAVLLWAFSLVVIGCLTSPTDGAISVKVKTILNVGGSGSYDQVVDMPCMGGRQPQCIRQPKQVSGCLAPFDEEQSLKIRGPLDILEVGVYYPSGGSWNRVSYYNQAGVSNNIVFMGNYGRSNDGHDVDESACHTLPGENAAMIINGDDFMCHGYNTTYASHDGKCASKSAQHFSGRLEDTVEVNIMQGSKCGQNGCGYHRGMAHRGWDGPGGSKIFAVKIRYTDGYIHNAPALWYLHADVMRTANYHFPAMCNCRGVGSPGGCGELDIAEVVTEKNQKQDVETTIYSFKGAYSDQNAYKFERIADREMVFVTIFNQEGYIQILHLEASEFGFDGSLSNAFVNELNSRRELVMRMPGPDHPGCSAPKCSYIHSMDGGFAARLEDGVKCEGGGNGGRSMAQPTPQRYEPPSRPVYTHNPNPNPNHFGQQPGFPSSPGLFHSTSAPNSFQGHVEGAKNFFAQFPPGRKLKSDGAES